MVKTCAQCGAEYRTRSSKRRFCSRPCFYESMRNPDARYHPQERTCVVCGKKFMFKWQGTPQHKGLYHSRECASIARKGKTYSPTGENHPNWKGGRVEWPGGYMAVRVGKKYVLEHRHVMSQELGRPLTSDETIHHKNGDRTDNRIENLELRVGRHGRGATEKHCRTCTCFEHTESQR